MLAEGYPTRHNRIPHGVRVSPRLSEVLEGERDPLTRDRCLPSSIEIAIYLYNSLEISTIPNNNPREVWRGRNISNELVRLYIP